MGVVVLGVTCNNKAFRLIGLYAGCARRMHTDFNQRLEKFLVMSKTLVALGDKHRVKDFG